MEKSYVLPLLIAFGFMTSCATVLRQNTDETITFAPAQNNTLVFVNGDFKGISPVEMILDKDSTYHVKYVNRNFMSKSFQMQSSIIKKWMWMDLLSIPVTAFVPLVVDHHTGAWKGFDNSAVPGTMVLWSDIKDPHDYLDEIFQIENLYFETGKAVIQPEGYENLNKLASMLQNFEDIQLHIHGHTDQVGDEEMNLQLSVERALAVKEYLAKKGIAADRMEAEGFGENYPLIIGETEEAFQYNRRVEFSYFLKP